MTVGGETALPFLDFEGAMPHRPVIAVEVSDLHPDDWSAQLQAAWGDAMDDAAVWAQKAEEAGADLIALSCAAATPTRATARCESAVRTVERVLAAVPVPLIVYGPGQADKDNEVLVAVAEKTKGEQLALGNCEDKNYRTIVPRRSATGTR